MVVLAMLSHLPAQPDDFQSQLQRTMSYAGPYGLLLAALSVLLLGAPLAKCAPVQLPASLPGDWQTFGRAQVTISPGSVTIAEGLLADLTPRGDCVMTLRAQMPAEAPQVQIWAGIRVKDRKDRYAFALRGGAEPELTLARYATDDNSKFLGFATLLDTPPKPGHWYTLRVAVLGKRFLVFLNDEKLPRINVEDKDAQWTDGGVALGGGWLPAQFAEMKVTPIGDDERAAFLALGDQVGPAPDVDKAAVRAQQRAAYRPVAVANLPALRGEISLDGYWLFMPDQDLAPGAKPSGGAASDDAWNVLAVPNFWTPTFAWLHGEDGMPGLKGLAGSKGPSDKLIAEEYARCNAQTFDWTKTKAGWYRQHLNLPADLGGRSFHLVFDAVAKIAEVYVNGTLAGSNTGMFRQIDCDVTSALKPGENIIAVHVIGQPVEAASNSDKVEAIAVTVAVTKEMTSSIPHGMTGSNSSGIWQPVRLVVTAPVHVSDVFIQPRLDGASATVTVSNADRQDHAVQLSYAIRDRKGGSPLDAGPAGSATVPGGGSSGIALKTPQLQPKLWSPDSPSLYSLQLTLTQDGKIVDQQETTFGFRTFSVEGSRFLLNGHPYWLRGGNPFPATLRPNDGELARKFMTLAHEGNVNVTRTHGWPFTSAWLDAADEQGIGVSFEGTWPWLMIKGEPPSPDLLKIWKDEFSALIRQNRNHPSLLLWTVNNEMNFARFDEKDDALLGRKWTVLSDMITTIRQLDPTRPISAYSGYTRKEANKSFQEVVTPQHFDDGDIDDAHVYFGWYNPSFFHLFNGEFAKQGFTNRPLISQETSTGYPRNDDWPSRSYEFKRYTAETIVGDYALEGHDPMIFLTRQAFITKETAEAIRRKDRGDTAGLLLFSYLTWFTDVWDKDQIRPKLTYDAVKTAFQPVLVSVELYGRHFFAGAESDDIVSIVNDADDRQDLPAGQLTWEIRAGNDVLAEGEQDAPPVPYYANRSFTVPFKMPADIAGGRVDAKLVLTYTANSRVTSVNTYDIVVATRDWAESGAKSSGEIQVFDPSGEAAELLNGYKTAPVSTLQGLSSSELLVVDKPGDLVKDSAAGNALKSFVEQGGRMLLLHPGVGLETLFPDMIKSYRSTVGEIVAMENPDSPIFDGIEPLDTAWFEMGHGQIPYACSGTYEVNRDQAGIDTLAGQCDFHSEIKPGDFFKIAGAPIVEIHLGKGLVLASEMMYSARNADPIADRLLSNALTYLSHQRQK
jgi:hypothetical protein